MIDIFTLMIGNLVGHKDHPKDVYQIIALDLFNAGSCKLIEEPLGYLVEANCSDLIPITLNDSVLKAIGFNYGKTGKKKDDTFTQYWDKKTPQHSQNFGSFTFTIVRWWNDNKPGDLFFSHQQMRSDCKYLHQLQNLWLSNTCQKFELKVDELISAL